MPRTARGLELRVFGAENARGRITNYRQTTKARIVGVLERNAPVAVSMMRDAMRAAYTSGTGKAAASITGDVTDTVTGPAVRISIANYREVKYLTTLLPDSDFRGGPYPIYPSQRERLVFFFKNAYGGARWVALKRVMHPGFGRQGDVLRTSGEAALAWLGRSVEQEVRSAVAEIHSGGTVFSVSRRR